MMPLVIVSADKKATNNFVKEFIKEHRFSRDRVAEISPLKKDIVISQIRDVRKKITISSPFPRLFIFYNFDKATLEAQNAFLKSLEDGSLKNQFLLIVENEHLLLPTVRSRSTTLKLDSKKNTSNNTDSLAVFFKKIESSPSYEFLLETTLGSSAREDILKLFDNVINYYRNKLFFDPKAVKIIKKALNLRTLLESNNLNPQLAYDNLLIFVFKVFRMKI